MSSGAEESSAGAPAGGATEAVPPASADPGRGAVPVGASRPPADHVLVDIDPSSFLVLAGAASLAMAVFAVAGIASDVLTGIGVGVLLGVALSPVVSGV